MRSTKAFLLGLGTAVLIDRARARRRDHAAAAVPVDDATIEELVISEALPAAGVSTRDVGVEVEDGVVTLQGSVEGSSRADALVQRVAKVAGVRDVAAIIRVSERHAA